MTGQRMLLRAEILRGGVLVVAHTMEVGPHYAIVRADHGLEPGDAVRLTLSFPRLLPPVELDAVVESKNPSSGPGYSAGVRVAFAGGSEDHEPLARLFSIADGGAAETALRILVVEDSAVIRDFVEAGADRFFRKGPMRVTLDSAESAEDAWELVQRESYQLALIDLYLEGAMSGADLVRRMRTQPGLEDLPIVGFSIGGAAAREELLAAGVDLFLEKPVMVRDVFATLERLTLMRTVGDA